MELAILMGLQGSGKSTFCATKLHDTHLRVSLDVVRTRKREEAIVKTALSIGQRTVIDNTNPTRADRAKYVGWAREAKCRVIGYYFSSELKPCMARNQQRSGKKVVPEKGILGTYSKLEIPSIDEGFDELSFVSIVDGDFKVQEWRNEV